MEARNIYSSQTTMLAARHVKIHAQEERPFIANLKSPVIVKNHRQMDKFSLKQFSCNILQWRRCASNLNKKFFVSIHRTRGRQNDLIALPDRRFKESVTQKNQLKL